MVGLPQTTDGDFRGQLQVRELAAGLHLIRSSDTESRRSQSGGELRIAAPERVALGFRFSCAAVSGHGVLAVADGSKWCGQPEFPRRGSVQFVDELVLPDYLSIGEGRSQAIVIDVDRLGVPVDAVRDAISSLSSSPVYDLFRDHLDRLCVLVDDLPDDDQSRPMLATATLELARALVTASAGEERSTRKAPHTSERSRISTYIRRHLRDPRLCAQSIARAHQMSVRQLYVVWESSGLSLAEHIVAARLEGARQDLARPELIDSTIAAIAASWGFTSPAHFSRRFRAAYAVSPLHWRRGAGRSARADGQGG